MKKDPPVEQKGNWEGLKNLWLDPVMRTNLMSMAIIWSFGSFAFFLVPYYLSSIKGANIYALSLATEFAEFLASIICIFITRIVKL